MATNWLDVVHDCICYIMRILWIDNRWSCGGHICANKRILSLVTDMMIIGNKMYDVCGDCGKMVCLNKTIFGALHFCLTPEELAHKRQAMAQKAASEAHATENGYQALLGSLYDKKADVACKAQQKLTNRYNLRM